MGRAVAACVCLLVVCVAAASAARVWRELPAERKHEYTFEDFEREFSRAYPTPAEREERRKIFEETLADIHRHNSNAAATYRKGVNHLSDLSDKEFARMLGYRKDYDRAFGSNGDGHLPASMVTDVPDHVDWRDKGVVTPVKDQGMCGSCWAFASTETIESQVAMSTTPPVLMELSPQQLVSCAPNTKHCGGIGGCEGSIPELAFDYVKANGMTTEYILPYTSYNGKSCMPSCNCTYDSSTKKVEIGGWTKVQSNDLQDVLKTSASVGPVAVNVAASPWKSYESGVFPAADCNVGSKGVDINHVVQLVGYDLRSGPGYLIIRNSWSPLWGLNGYIHLSADSQCFSDPTPLDGTGCEGGPKNVTVCGTCGVLYDVSFPTGARIYKPRD